MSKRHRRSGISKHLSPREEGVTPEIQPRSPFSARELPDLRKRPAFSGWARWLVLFVAVSSLACALVGVLRYADLMDQTSSLPNAPLKLKTPAWVSKSEEDRIVDQFMRLKNAKDPEADALLGPVPAVPEHPLRKAEAEALQAEFFLRDDLRVVEIRRYSDLPAHRGEQGYVLVTIGNVSALRLAIWKDEKETESESSQRTMSNPDIHLRVTNGKIVPIRPELNTEP